MKRLLLDTLSIIGLLLTLLSLIVLILVVAVVYAKSEILGEVTGIGLVTAVVMIAARTVSIKWNQISYSI